MDWPHVECKIILNTYLVSISGALVDYRIGNTSIARRI